MISSLALAADLDVVLLKGGGRVQGTVIEDDPQAGISIRLVDGTMRKISRAKVETVNYAADKTEAAPPAPASPPPAPVPVAPQRRRAQRHHSEESDDAQSDDDGYLAPNSHWEKRSLTGLWVSGLVVDLSIWALRAAITMGICGSYSSGARGCNGLDYGGAATPVIGAWIETPNAQGGHFAALVASGLVETAGFVLFITGLAAHRKVAIHDRYHDSDDGQLRMTVVPTTMNGGSGLVLVGQF